MHDIYIYIYIYIYICIYIYIYIHMYMHTYTYAYVYAYAYIYICKCIICHMCLCAFRCARMDVIVSVIRLVFISPCGISIPIGKSY